MNTDKLFYIFIGVIIIVGLVHLYMRYVSVESFQRRVERDRGGKEMGSSKSDISRKEQKIAEARAKKK